MASKKVYIDVVVDDKGTTKRVAVDAKALGDQLDKSGASTDRATKSQDRLRESTDRVSRSTRGAAQTAKSGTKNFANMASGIQGGLVPAYATLAANIFAITALFDALSRAADFTKLLAGQEALAANTGIAYKSITNSIKEATGAQISYKDAASAAAIGGAAGLSSDQLTSLGKAAKDTSLVLGRDLTDSFNRLIRGVTKAEPELLDELGIVLRLEPATQKYADSIGKAVGELSAYERSQAVANEVLAQAERKFGDAAAGADNAGESIQRLKSSFDSMLETVQSFLIKGLAPVFDFLANNTASLVATMTILGSGIVTALTPAAPKMSLLAQAAGGAEERIRALSTGAGKLGEKLSDGLELSAKDFNQLEKSANAANSGIIRVSGETKDAVLADIGIMRERHEAEQAKMRGGWKKYAAEAKAGRKAILIESGKIVGGFKIIARGGSMLLRALPFVGIAFMLFDLVKMTGIFSKKFSEEMQKAEKATTDFSNAIKTLNEDLFITARNFSLNAKGAKNAAIATAGMLQSGNFKTRIEEFEALDKRTEGYKEAQKDLARSFVALAVVSKNTQFKEFARSILKGEKLTLKQKSTLSTLTSEYIEGAQALQRWLDTYDSIQRSLRSAAGKVDTPLSSLVTTLTSALAQAETGMQSVRDTASDTADEFSRTRKEFTAVKERRDESARAVNRLAARRQELIDAGARPAGRRGGGDRELNRIDKLLKAEEARLGTLEQQRLEAEARAKTDARDKRLSEDDLEIEEKKVGVVQRQLAIAVTGQTTIVGLQKKRASLERQLAERQTQGITIQQKQQNLQNQGLVWANQILSAQEAIVAANTEYNVAQAVAGELTKEQQQLYEDQIKAAEERLKTTIEEVKTKAEANRIEQDTLEFQKTINGLKIQELNATKQINQERSKLRSLESGLGESFGFAAARGLEQQRRVTADADLTGAQSTERLAQTVFENARDRRDGEEESEEAFINAEKALVVARQRTQEAKIRRDIAFNTENILQKELKAQTELLAFETKMQSLHPAQELYNQNVLAYKNAGVKLTRENLAFIEEETLKQQELANTLELKQSLQESISNNFTQAFQSISDGSKNAKQAFSEMARSMLADLAQMITRAFVLKTLLPAIPGIGALVKEPAAPAVTGDNRRYGGIVGPKARAGGLFEPYAMGGIARGRDAGYPAVLHGTEAVVPLPNGREIPVEMVGGASGTNNVSVNISMDNQGGGQQQNTADNNQMRNLGLAISGAVQEELQRQKRPGGILSPYGAA